MANGYPSLEAAKAAGVYDLLRWSRFLPSPRDDDQVAILNVIVERLPQEREKDNAAYVAASKSIGF